MRSLIVRFKDCEGPGVISDILHEKGYQVTYHNAYARGLHLIPDSHLIFDLVVLLGGPQSVADPSLRSFFKPYRELVRNLLRMPNRKMIGVCLGSQIIASALGGEVIRGEKGAEVGFGKLEITEPNHPLFAGLTTKDIPVFHLHEDSFSLPMEAKLLAKSDQYQNQIFSVADRIFGFQAHLEVTEEMLRVWARVHEGFLKSNGGIKGDIAKDTSPISSAGRTIFQNLIGKS